jgi:hypothetical protein
MARTGRTAPFMVMLTDILSRGMPCTSTTKHPRKLSCRKHAALEYENTSNPPQRVFSCPRQCQRALQPYRRHRRRAGCRSRNRDESRGQRLQTSLAGRQRGSYGRTRSIPRRLKSRHIAGSSKALQCTCWHAHRACRGIRLQRALVESTSKWTQPSRSTADCVDPPCGNSLAQTQRRPQLTWYLGDINRFCVLCCVQGLHRNALRRVPYQAFDWLSCKVFPRLFRPLRWKRNGRKGVQAEAITASTHGAQHSTGCCVLDVELNQGAPNYGAAGVKLEKRSTRG